MTDYLFEAHILEKELQDLIAAFPELADDETLRADTIEGETNATAVLSRIVDQAQEAKSMAAAINERAVALKARSARYERRNNAMRRLALRLLRAADLPRMVLPEATLVRVKGRDVVDITDESALPGWAFNVSTTKTPSKTAIKEAIDAGLTVPGAALRKNDESLQLKDR